MAEVKTQTVELNGNPFFVRTWGDESLPKMLLLHGFPEYGGAWTDVAERLSTHYHCIAPDQRGYGQSWSPPEVSHYTIPEMLNDLVALIGNEPIIVVGHDWGASMAYGLAMFHPELVKKLIIMNGVHYAPFQRALAAGGAQSEASQYITYLRQDGSEDRLIKDNCAKLLTLFSAHMNMDWLTGDTRDAYLREWQRPGNMRAMVNWYRASPLTVAAPGETITNLPDFPRDKFKVACPHLLIWGTDDTALLPEATQGLEDYAADLTRVEIAGADHWLHHQKPAEVAAAILNWLDQ